MTTTTNGAQGHVRGRVLPEVVRNVTTGSAVEWDGLLLIDAVSEIDARELRADPLTAASAFSLSTGGGVYGDLGLPSRNFRAKVAELAALAP